MFGEIEKNMEIIPSFWNKAAVDGTIEKLCPVMNGDIKGMMGVCDCTSPKYFIAVNSHSDIPEDMEEYIVAERTWAVFYGEGECPSAIQNLEKDIYTDWLPSSGYELLHEDGFPVLRVGNRMVVPKDAFIRWVESHTGGGG